MLKIRCSQLGLLMTKAKSGGGLSETAKGMVKDIVREQFFGVRKNISNKAIEKGIRCEDESIKLLNDFLFTDYVKHVGRVENDYITGECDILSVLPRTHCLRMSFKTIITSGKCAAICGYTINHALMLIIA